MLNQHSPASLTLIVLVFAGCGDRAADAPKDRYAPEQMELRSPPARVTSERHTGEFASGTSLNKTAELRSLDRAQVKDVRLDTTHKIIEIAIPSG